MEMKTQKQSVKFVKNELMIDKPWVPQIYEPKVKSSRESQPQRTTSQERTQFRQLKQNKVSVPPLFSDPVGPAISTPAGLRWDQPRFELGGLEEERLRRKIVLGQAVDKKNTKFNFSANSKSKQESDKFNDQTTISNSLTQFPNIKSAQRNLRPTPTIYSSESCSTLSIKHQPNMQIVFSPRLEPAGNRRTTKIIGYQNKESNLIEDNDPTQKNEYPINKTE